MLVSVCQDTYTYDVEQVRRADKLLLLEQRKDSGRDWNE
jgi:hypothetical protein